MGNEVSKTRRLELGQWIIISVIETGVSIEHAFELIQPVFSDVWGTDMPGLPHILKAIQIRYIELQEKVDRNENLSANEELELQYLHSASSEFIGI